MHYFRFEEDFVEDNVRCIPMIARFKLDTCGVKLKLAEWSRMSVEERSSSVQNICPAVGPYACKSGSYTVYSIQISAMGECKRSAIAVAEEV
jgi:hypothetical protein